MTNYVEIMENLNTTKILLDCGLVVQFVTLCVVLVFFYKSYKINKELDKIYSERFPKKD